MQGHAGSIISSGDLYYRKKAMQNEILFVMLTCSKHTGAPKRLGRETAHLHLIAEVQKE